MKNIKETSNIILGILFVVVAGYAMLRIATGGWHAYKSLSDNAQIAIAVAVLSLLGTIWSLYYTKIKDRELQINASHSAKKQKLYNQFTSDIIQLLSNPEKANDEDFMQKMRIRFISNSFLWSNPKVLQTYHKFRSDAQETGAELNNLINIASLFLAFRDDLGLSNKNVSEQTILEIIFDKKQLEDSNLSFNKN